MVHTRRRLTPVSKVTPVSRVVIAKTFVYDRSRNNIKDICGIMGRPNSTYVWCLDDLGRESWDWEGQESVVWQGPIPPRGFVPERMSGP